MKNTLFNIKSVQTGSYKAEVGAGAGAETNSFGSATLVSSNRVISSLAGNVGILA
jgi:hypothetical protein